MKLNMKTLTTLFAMIAIVISASAQTEVQPTPAAPQNVQPKSQQAPVEKQTPPQREFVKMVNGKLMHVKGNTESVLDKEITIGETKVKPDGTVTMKDGTTAKMKEGTIVNAAGRMIDMSMLKQKTVEPKQPQQTAPPKE